jgi:rhodanese-related sulfurtransferase
MTPQLPPAQFHAWRDAVGTPTQPAVVLDVREPWELQTASVTPDGFTLLHIPMRELPARLDELRTTYGEAQAIACLCHHGMRSQQVATFLTQSGFTDVVNLQGGIAAWSQQVDVSVPQY